MSEQSSRVREVTCLSALVKGVSLFRLEEKLCF